MKTAAIFFALLALCGPLLADHPAWDDQLNFEEIEERLRSEAVVEKKELRVFLEEKGKTVRGGHSIHIITLASGLKAVFKKGNDRFGEVAAYKMARALGLRLVPPTVMRTIDGLGGSLQFFVDSTVDLVTESDRVDWRKLRPKDVSNKDVFYYLVGQWDTHRGNQAIAQHNGNYYLALIDNAAIRAHRHNKKNRVKIYYKSTLEALKRLNREIVAEIWADYMPFNKEHGLALIEFILKRRDILVAAASTSPVIWDI